jgi:flagellar biosynthesis/type III secretory pathway protein FliH
VEPDGTPQTIYFAAGAMGAAGMTGAPPQELQLDVPHGEAPQQGVSQQHDHRHDLRQQRVAQQGVSQHGAAQGATQGAAHGAAHGHEQGAAHGAAQHEVVQHGTQQQRLRRQQADADSAKAMNTTARMASDNTIRRMAQSPFKRI